MQNQKVLQKNNTDIRRSKVMSLKEIKKKPSSDIHVKKIVIDTNVDKCFPPDKSGISYKEELSRLFKKKKPINELFNSVQFNLVNPTKSPCSFNLFDGWSITPVPNTPNGYVPDLDPLGTPQINFPTSYPSFECDVINLAPLHRLSLRSPLATTYVPSTDSIYVTVNSIAFTSVTLVINPNNNVITNTISIPLPSSWMSMYSSVSNKVYVIDQTDSIVPIDCVTESVLPTIILPAPVSQISYTSSNNYLYVTVPSLDRLYYIDCSTDTVVGFISLVGSGSSANSIVNWSVGLNNYAVVLNSINSNAFYINTTTNTIISIFNITNSTNIYGSICYNSVKNTIYYLDSLNLIREINMDTRIMLPTSISGFNDSYQLFFLSSNNVIYATRVVSTFAEVGVINCVTNVIDLIIPTSIDSTNGSRLAYDNVNNSMWVTGSGTDNRKISKLCSSDMCYIVGSTSYNEFIQDFRNSPKCVRQIALYTQNVLQTSTPFEVTKRDANGNLCTVPRLPNITLSTDQFQPNIAMIDFGCKKLILDNTYIFSNYVLQPNSTVIMIIYYKEISIGDVLTNKKTLCETTEPKCSDGNSRRESEIKFQTQRPHTRPSYTKSFKDKITGKKGSITIDTNVNACDFESLGRGVVVPESKKKMFVDLEEAKPMPIEVSTNVNACNFDELGRPNFTAELSKNITKTVVLEDAKPMPIFIDTNVGKCEEVCSVVDDSNNKKINLDKFYLDATKNFDVFQNGIRIRKY